MLSRQQLLARASFKTVGVTRLRVAGDAGVAQQLDAVLNSVLDGIDNLEDPRRVLVTLAQDFPGSFGCCGCFCQKLALTGRSVPDFCACHSSLPLALRALMCSLAG